MDPGIINTHNIFTCSNRGIHPGFGGVVKYHTSNYFVALIPMSSSRIVIGPDVHPL